MSITARIDAVTQIPEARRLANPPPPLAAKIELTSRCNLACAFCAHGGRDDTATAATIDRGLYRHIVQQLVEAGVREIGLFYVGESCLCPWLPEAVAEAKQLGAEYVFLTTNGVLATADRMDACMRAGLDSLKWSYNNADEQQFQAMTGRPGRLWRQVNAHIQAASERRAISGYATRLYASSIWYDDEQAARMQQSLAVHVLPWVDEHYWLPLYSFGGLATSRERAKALEPSAGNRGRLAALRDPLPCWAVFQEAHITAAGLLSACCFDPGRRWVMGDLTREPFVDAWASPAFQELRQAHLNGDVTGTACAACAVLA